MSQKQKLLTLQATFLPVLTYGLEALTITEKQLHRLDAHYIRFLRRIVGIKVSFYSHVTNQEVYRKARFPKLPSDLIAEAQFKMLQEVYHTAPESPLHNVVFAAAFEDRIVMDCVSESQTGYALPVLDRSRYPHPLSWSS